MMTLKKNKKIEPSLGEYLVALEDVYGESRVTNELRTVMEVSEQLVRELKLKDGEIKNLKNRHERYRRSHKRMEIENKRNKRDAEWCLIILTGYVVVSVLYSIFGQGKIQ